MKGFLCLVLSALFLVTVGCSGNSNDQVGKQEQGLHLLSLKVKVIAMVENEDNLFLVEALESYKDEINQGDTISLLRILPKSQTFWKPIKNTTTFGYTSPKSTILRME